MTDPHHLREAILKTLRARAPGSTICPSEVARAVAPADWRPLMPLVRAAAVALAHEGRLIVRQRGAAIPVAGEIKGLIRLALPEP